MSFAKLPPSAHMALFASHAINLEFVMTEIADALARAAGSPDNVAHAKTLVNPTNGRKRNLGIKLSFHHIVWADRDRYRSRLSKFLSAFAKSAIKQYRGGRFALPAKRPSHSVYAVHHPEAVRLVSLPDNDAAVPCQPDRKIAWWLPQAVCHSSGAPVS